MRLAGQLPLLLCSNIKTLCINALKQSRTLLRMWLKIFCQAWHLFHGAHSHCKAVKLSCCLRPWHTFSSLRKYTRVMLQATHSNSVVPLLEAKAALCWATKVCKFAGQSVSRGKLIPVWSCMILTLASCLRVFSNSNGEETHVGLSGLKWSFTSFWFLLSAFVVVIGLIGLNEPCHSLLRAKTPSRCLSVSNNVHKNSRDENLLFRFGYQIIST